CFEHRKYEYFGNNEKERTYIPGIQFYTTNENNIVINYPKKHYSFGVDKNNRTNNKYKTTIRIFKNIKKRLLEQKKITSKVTSSYFIENLLYNVPDRYFNIENSSIRVANILNWLIRSEEHTSELQSRFDIVCRLLLEKKNKRRVRQIRKNPSSALTNSTNSRVRE